MDISCALNENYRFTGVFGVSVLFQMSRRYSPHQSKIGTRHGSIRLAVKKLEHEIEHAGNYDEYEAACLAHDALSVMLRNGKPKTLAMTTTTN